ncbi:hypothetical protein [Stenotrophomonas geniculata]|uniref:hypothetical protein n=1 Tax=Stenotrophomonas geniculata TaxID=86188 RepID=UPI003CE5BB0E
MAFAASVSQGKRYGEPWCAARLYLDLPLREAVARLTDTTPVQPAPPPPGLPPTREQQQQARRLADAGAKEVERIKAALEPRRPPAETKDEGLGKGWTPLVAPYDLTRCLQKTRFCLVVPQGL